MGLKPRIQNPHLIEAYGIFLTDVQLCLTLLIIQYKREISGHENQMFIVDSRIVRTCVSNQVPKQLLKNIYTLYIVHSKEVYTVHHPYCYGAVVSN